MKNLLLIVMLFVSGLSIAQSRVLHVERYNNFLDAGDALLITDNANNCVDANRDSRYSIIYSNRDSNLAWNRVTLGLVNYELVSPISDASATPRRGWYRNRNSNWLHTEIQAAAAEYRCVGDHGLSLGSQTRNGDNVRYTFNTVQNGLRQYSVDFTVYDDITGERLLSRNLQRSPNGEAELITGSAQFDVPRPLPGHRHRIEVTVFNGEQGDYDETFYSQVNADENIIIKDFAQGWVRFWTVSNITNNDDRVNVRAISRLVDGRISHNSYSGWKRITPNRVLADGYTKEYIYSHDGRRRVENFETIEVNAQRDGQGEFTRKFQLQGPRPRLRFRLSRNSESNKQNAEWRIRTEWQLNLPPQWDESQILDIQSSAYSEERLNSASVIWRWVREQSHRHDGLNIDRTRRRGASDDGRDENMWRYTDNTWWFTVTFLRREPMNGRLERYTVRYQTSADGIQPGTNSTTDRHAQYNGAVTSPTINGNYWFTQSHNNHWFAPHFPNSLLDGQRQ